MARRGAKSVKPQLMESVSASETLRLVHMNGSEDSGKGSSPEHTFESVDKCPLDELSGKSVASDLDGTLLLSRSSFPYFMLVAFEAGSPLRAVVLLLLSPIAWVLYNLISEELGIKFLIFLSCAGLKRSALESVARGVLPKFYLEDMHPITFKIFTSCEKRVVVTANPRILVEPFLRDYLDVDTVLGTELRFSSGGYCTGFTTAAGVLVGPAKERAVKRCFGSEMPDVGLGDRETDHDFMSLCKVDIYMPISFHVSRACGRASGKSDVLWRFHYRRFLIERKLKQSEHLLQYLVFELTVTFCHTFPWNMATPLACL